MSPFTPFFTEQMYQNLRRCQPEGEAPESVHYCDFPTAQEPYAGDAQIQKSVDRMQTVIELSRTIRLDFCILSCMALKYIYIYIYIRESLQHGNVTCFVVL